MRNYYSLLLPCFLLAASVAFAAPCPAQPPSLLSRRMVLDQIRYKPKEQGPLLWVGPADMLTYPANDDDLVRQKFGTISIQKFADQMQRRLVHSGNLSAIVPATMQVMPKTFGTPNPFADMTRSERIQVLLSLFTREQWRMAGSESGIGKEEMTKNQRPLFDSLFTSDVVTIKRTRIERASDGSGDVYSHGGEDETVTLAGARLRLSRRVHFTFHAFGTEKMYSSSAGDNDGFRTTAADGTVIRQYWEMQDTVAPPPYTDVTYSYGVPVIQTVPSRLKPGQLDLDMPFLSTPILLDGSALTVGELLRTVAKSTRLDLTVDKRYAAFAVSYRIAPGGQSVRAGDLLKILCRSVNGTFRRLDPPQGGEPLYLLTDDIEGVGARFARLDRWACKPAQEGQEALEQATKKSAAQTPLEFIGFAPGDPLALSDKQRQRIDDSYRGITDNPEMTPADLSPALHKELDRQVKDWATSIPEPILLKKDSFGVNTQINFEVVLPDKRAFPLPTGFSNSGSFLYQLASAQRKATTEFTPEPEIAHSKASAAIKRRVLIAPLPPATQVATLLKFMHQKGFTEIWFAVPPTDDIPKRLQQAIAVGKAKGISVGAVVSWLLRKEADEQASEDRNILGETGSEWYQHQGVQDSAWGATHQEYYRTQFTGRILPGSEVTLRRCAAIAHVPNLCALVLQDTAAPGWAGWSPYREPENRLGYSLETRLSCVRTQGFDPIDVALPLSYAGVSSTWEDWDGDLLRPALGEFLRKRNAEYMRQVFTRLHTGAPQLPLYVADPGRGSQVTTLPYFVRWEKPDALPRIADSVDEKQVHAAASALSKDSLLASTTAGWEINPAYFWQNANKQVDLAKHWGGFVWNLEPDPMPDVLKFLAELPDDSPPRVADQ